MAIKKKYSAQTVVLTTERTRARLDRLAEEREVSVSAVIRQALEIGLAQMDPQGEQTQEDTKRARAA